MACSISVKHVYVPGRKATIIDQRYTTGRLLGKKPMAKLIIVSLKYKSGRVSIIKAIQKITLTVRVHESDTRLTGEIGMHVKRLLKAHIPLRIFRNSMSDKRV